LTTLMKSCDHAVPNGLRAELAGTFKKNAPPSFGSVTCAFKDTYAFTYELVKDRVYQAAYRRRKTRN